MIILILILLLIVTGLLHHYYIYVFELLVIHAHIEHCEDVVFNHFNCIYSVCDIPLKYMYGLDFAEEASVSLNLLPLVLKQTYAIMCV